MYKTPDVDYVKELQLYNATIYKMFPEGKMLVLPKQNSHQSQLRVEGLTLWILGANLWLKTFVDWHNSFSYFFKWNTLYLKKTNLGKLRNNPTLFGFFVPCYLQSIFFLLWSWVRKWIQICDNKHKLWNVLRFKITPRMLMLKRICTTPKLPNLKCILSVFVENSWGRIFDDFATFR